VRTRVNEGGAGTADGWLEVLMLQLLLALPSAESAALAVKLLAPTPLGTPVTAPVAVLRLKPAGSAPVIEYV
jgi:hypothetical protein